MNKTIAAQLERIDRQLNRIYADRINALTEIDGLRKRRHPDLAQKLADFAEQKKEMDRLHDRMNRLKTLQGQINDRNKHRGLL